MSDLIPGEKARKEVKKRNLQALVDENSRLQNEVLSLKAQFNLLSRNQQTLMNEFAQLKQLILVEKAKNMGRGATA